MILCRIRMTNVQGDQDEYNKVQQFFMAFENGFKDVQNLVLIGEKNSSANKGGQLKV